MSEEGVITTGALGLTIEEERGDRNTNLNANPQNQSFHSNRTQKIKQTVDLEQRHVAVLAAAWPRLRALDLCCGLAAGTAGFAAFGALRRLHLAPFAWDVWSADAPLLLHPAELPRALTRLEARDVWVAGPGVDAARLCAAPSADFGWGVGVCPCPVAAAVSSAVAEALRVDYALAGEFAGAVLDDIGYGTGGSSAGGSSAGGGGSSPVGSPPSAGAGPSGSGASGSGASGSGESRRSSCGGGGGAASALLPPPADADAADNAFPAADGCGSGACGLGVACRCFGLGAGGDFALDDRRFDAIDALAGRPRPLRSAFVKASAGAWPAGGDADCGALALAPAMAAAPAPGRAAAAAAAAASAVAAAASAVAASASSIPAAGPELELPSPGLRRLVLRSVAGGDGALRLPALSALTALIELDVTHSALAAADLEAITVAPCAGTLRVLRLAAGDGGAGGAQRFGSALACVTRLTALEELRLTAHERALGRRVRAAVASMTQLRRLTIATRPDFPSSFASGLLVLTRLGRLSELRVGLGFGAVDALNWLRASVLRALPDCRFVALSDADGAGALDGGGRGGAGSVGGGISGDGGVPLFGGGRRRRGAARALAGLARGRLGRRRDGGAAADTGSDSDCGGSDSESDDGDSGDGRDGGVATADDGFGAFGGGECAASLRCASRVARATWAG